VSLSDVVRSISEHLKKAGPNRAAEFTIQDDVFAVIDPNLARALLDNLLSNAWKFTAKLGVARIEFGRTDTARGAAFFVRDNGAGFDMAYAKKLFVPFQRLHSTVEYPGTGIGLATVQRIVRRHGGDVWAEGTPGAGATFYFSLPARSNTGLE